MAAKLFFYKTDDKVGRRQYPLSAGENLMMLMDLNSKGLVIDSPHIRGKELEEFTRKFNLLTSDELRKSLEIDSVTFMSVLNQCVTCVGCRRRVERLFYQLTVTGYPTVDPLMLMNPQTQQQSLGVLTITDEKMRTPQALGTLLYRHHEVLNNLLDSKLRNKTRCVLHSLDAFRSKPFSESWREVWSAMKHNCRDELTVIETKELHEVLEGYLTKHKFCQGCRTKIEKAYKILVGETTTKEKGFVAPLYANIKKCYQDKHIHVITNKLDFLDALMRRAEPEINLTFSKQRERHAKTLEIAQEEVLTCVGMIMYERLRRICGSMREEERACQVLAAVGVHALYRSFDLSVEKKQGISNLELLYQEISRAEKAKEYKREQKKLKKKKKKIEKKKNNMQSNACANDEDEAVDFEEDSLAEETEAGQQEDEDEHEEEDDDDVDGDDAMHHNVSSDTESGVHEENVAAMPFVPVKTAAKKKKLPKPQRKQKQPAASKKNRKKQPTARRDSSRCSGNHHHDHHHDDNNNSTNTATTTTTTTANETTTNKRYISESPSKCNDCLAPANVCPCDSDVKDSGYGSEPNSHEISRLSSEISSHEGSEVSCLDGFCNHENPSGDGGDGHNVWNADQPVDYCGNGTLESLLCEQRMQTLSLQQMLMDFDDDGGENCYIPQEVVREYQCQHERVQQQRQQLRETLRQNFARLCMERGSRTTPTC